MIKYVWGCYFETRNNRFVKIKKNGYTPLRKVCEYEIEVYNSEGGISVINGKEFHIKKGNVLVAFPGDQRRSKPDFECYSLKFLCDDIEFTCKMKEIAGINYYENYDEIIKEIESIYLLAAEVDKEIVIDAKIRSVVAALYEKIAMRKSENFKHITVINKAVDFMLNNLDKKISLDDISNAAGLSAGHFHRVFREFYHMSPNDYLIHKRIESAKNLLMNNLISIDEVAEKCGFTSRAYFDVTFKKRTSLTPADFRRISFQQSVF
ncbi:MAG: helix-turn-helix transcriptional regulator [Clostridia bacterium]|nr:helix-turn-helix transcriptional regulator [Clostridia bacterium]